MHKVSATAAFFSCSTSEQNAGPPLNAAGSADGTADPAGPQGGELWCGIDVRYHAGCTFHSLMHP